MNPQVPSKHYSFLKYESEARFSSYYHQVKSTLELKPKTVLEVGCGSRAFLSLIKSYGVKAYSLDLDENLKPTICASILNLPLKDNAVDVVVAFQVLEHLPFDSFQSCLSEMARVSKKAVVISLPDFGNFGITLTIPFVRQLNFTFSALPFRPKHKFDGEHYWEINKSGYPLSKITSVIKKSGLNCSESMLNPYNPYHRFFIMLKE